MRTFVFPLIVLALVFSLVNCGAPFYISEEELEDFRDYLASQTITTGYVYAANSDNTISGYSVDSDTGMLSAVPNSPFGTANGPSFVISDAESRFLYVTHGTPANGVWGFTIADNGELTELPSNPVATGSSPWGVALDPSTRFAYVAYGTAAGQVYGYAVDSSSGSFTQTSGPFGTSCIPRYIAADPTGRYVYVSDGNISPNPYLRSYSIDQDTGSLTETTGSPLSITKRMDALAIDPEGSFLYSMEGFSSFNNIHAYAIDQSTGAITELGGSPYQLGGGGLTARGMAMDSDGRYLFVSSGTPDNSIYSYSIASSGGLVSSGSLGAASDLKAIAVDPLGKFVYVGAAAASLIHIYRIGGGGTLTEINDSPITTTSMVTFLGTARKELADPDAEDPFDD